MKSNNCNALSPARQSLTRLPKPFGQGEELVGSVSVARVRPRTSKGITAFSRGSGGRPLRAEGAPRNPRPGRCTCSGPPCTLACRTLLQELGYPKGLARTLSRWTAAHPFPRVATAQRYLSSPQDWPTRLPLGRVRRPLYQVVLPTLTRARGARASSRQ